MASVRPSVLPPVCLSLNFSQLNPLEPLCQFQPNLAQSILRWREFKRFQTKDKAHFQGEIITNWRNNIDKSSQEPLCKIQPNLAQSTLDEGNSSLFKWRPGPFPRGDNYEIAIIYWQNLKIYFSRTTEPISTKLSTKQPWVRVIQVCSNEVSGPFPKEDNYEIAKIY